MSPSTVDEIYNVEKILGKWRKPFLAIPEGVKLKFSPGSSAPTMVVVPILDLVSLMLKSCRRPCKAECRFNLL